LRGGGVNGASFFLVTEGGAPISFDVSGSVRAMSSGLFSGPADLLSGSFDLSGITGDGFVLTGFRSFADLIAGRSFGGLSVVFGDDAEGAFLATLVLHAAGSNASGYVGSLGDTTLVLRGEASAVAAVPEPETYALMLAGLLMVARMAHARRRWREGSPVG